MKLAKYVEITKPGIIRGNLIVAIAAFLFASTNSVDWYLFIATMAGIVLIIASAAVANNYLDKEIDGQMERTKKRALPSNAVSQQAAAIYSAILGFIGIGILAYFVNTITALIGFLSFIFYVFVYGYFKRANIYGTLVGAIPGAAPPLAGYTAATGHIDWLAVLLFLIMIFWQMPHFYAIAIFRKEDYKKAKLPVLPLVKGIYTTKLHSLAYIGLFIFSTSLLYAFNYTGLIFFLGMLAINIWWVKIAYDGLTLKSKSQNYTWAKDMFKTSLFVLIAYSFLLAINNFIT